MAQKSLLRKIAGRLQCWQITIESIEKSNELKDIFAKETYINQLKTQFENDLDREKARLLQKEEPTGNVEIVINRKTIKVNELLNRSS